MARKDRRRATTDAQTELRKQVIELREARKRLAETNAITGYAATYCSTLHCRFGGLPKALEDLARGGRPTVWGRALTAT